jgi:23S rRNA (adenine2503-C2)-methyltransferase
VVRDPAAELPPDSAPDSTPGPAPAPTPGQALPALSGLSLEALRALLVGMGEPAYRATQVFSFLWREGVLDPEAMTTLPRALRARLAQATRPSATTVLEVEESRDGTWKLLLGLRDGARVETVMIPEGDRRTVCVSTQVGCPIGCVFCASGVGGLLRNLDAAEIAEQVLVVRARLGARPSNVVVMGMGEPLLNLGALAAAVRIWQAPEGLDFGARRVTVSTAGTAPMIDRLAAEALGVNLAVSLHGPDDATRQRLVPGSPPGRVQDLVEAATRFARKTGRDVTVEYVLIEGENDGPEHAEALARLVAGRHIHVNLIPLNPVTHRPDLHAPSGLAVTGFARRLMAAGVFVKPRSRRGDDIHAACGQLALERAVPPSPSPEPRA